MVKFFIRGVGDTNKGKSTERLNVEMNNGNCNLLMFLIKRFK